MASNNEDFQNAIAMSVRQAAMTTETLRNIFDEFLRNRDQHREGLTSVSELTKSGRQLEDVKISKQNISDFQKTADKFNLSYALKRDNATIPPTYFVFFKNDGKSKDSFERAFSEFVQDLKKEPVIRSADIEKVDVKREKKAETPPQEREDLWANMQDTRPIEDKEI